MCKKEKLWLCSPLCFQNWNKQDRNQSNLRIWEKQKQENENCIKKSLLTKQEELLKEQTGMKPWAWNKNSKNLLM